MLEVGKTYETKEGNFTCIAVNDTHAWMKSGQSLAAYVWTHDGKSVSLNERYDIKPKTREYTLDPSKNHIWFSHLDGMIHVREVLPE